MIQSELEASAYLVLYGSLMSFFNTQDELGIRKQLKLLEQCELSGNLYDLGAYPGFINSQDKQAIVRAELYEILDPQALTKLDKFEDYWPDDESQSLYLRRLLSLKQSSKQAWVYIYNKSVIESVYIKSGSWQEHLKEIK